LLPDHLPLESWGYQRLSPAVDRALVSAIQPVVAPRYATHPTVDLLLESVHCADGKLASRLPYRNELEFLQQAVRRLPWGADIADPWRQWLAQGGWWTSQPTLLPPVTLQPPERWLGHAQAPWALDPSGEEFYLIFTQPAFGPVEFSVRTEELARWACIPKPPEDGPASGGSSQINLASGEIVARISVQPEIDFDTLVIPLLQAGRDAPLPWSARSKMSLVIWPSNLDGVGIAGYLNPSITRPTPRVASR